MIKTGLSLFGVALLLLSGINAYSTIAHFLGKPESLYVSSYLIASQIPRRIESGASICISGDPNLQDGPMGAIAYSLHEYPLYGDIRTIASSMTNVSLDDVAGQNFAVVAGNGGTERHLCDYVLLAADEDSRQSPFSTGELVWQNEKMKLYRWGLVIAQLDFDHANGGGQISSTKPLEIRVNSTKEEASSQGKETSQSKGSLQRSLFFQFGTFVEQVLSVEVEGKESELRMGPGLWQYELPSIALPVSIKIRSRGSEPLFLDHVQLSKTASSTASLTQRDGFLPLQTMSTAYSDRIVSHVRWVDPRSTAVPAWIEIWVRNAKDAERRSLVGRWPLGPSQEELPVTLHLADGAIEVAQPGYASSVAHWNPDSPDGQYVAELRVAFADGSESSQLPTELFSMTMRDNRVVEATPKAHPFLLRNLHSNGWTATEATFGENVRFLGYTLKERGLEPGGTARLSLYWQVSKGFDRDLRVFAHLVDTQETTWGQHDEGLLTSTRYQTGQSNVEVIRTNQDITVRRLAPTGEYAIEIGVYVPGTMERLPVKGPDLPYSDRIVIEGVKVVRPNPPS
ncbi:MAG: hypothetical protein M1305_04275 [Candidatus Marsarchaeota archaeon]|nr:hypothetical protein [Candidatus Marsarchaeota archaeon]